eukprot:TRINITY_DN13564_c0_g1_i2.p1 TRINITY_DN13564_c0_g1~~TRINITY_DN13564_c0_g1_i2.p1  ORF type:complete len:199 (+),score=-10.22 TRINITY_DN13564_c0_g1_i2:378-974(+)
MHVRYVYILAYAIHLYTIIHIHVCYRYIDNLYVLQQSTCANAQLQIVCMLTALRIISYLVQKNLQLFLSFPDQNFFCFKKSLKLLAQQCFFPQTSISQLVFVTLQIFLHICFHQVMHVYAIIFHFNGGGFCSSVINNNMSIYLWCMHIQRCNALMYTHTRTHIHYYKIVGVFFILFRLDFCGWDGLKRIFKGWGVGGC